MKRVPSDEKEVDMLATAYLAGEGRKPTEIASMLGISAVAVSRHLKEARKEYLRAQISFLRNKISPDLLDKVQQRVTRQDLQNQLNAMAHREGQTTKVSLRVFHCGPPAADILRMATLGAQAAPVIRTLLLESRSCGLTWGGMLKNVVNGLRDLPFPPPWTDEPIRFVPLSGEPLDRQRAKVSSSSLARDLGIVVNGGQYDAPSLRMVPAFIPDRFRQYEKDGVWKLIELVQSYRNIFGPRRNGHVARQATPRVTPLAFDLDMILTSVGAQDKPLGFDPGVLFDQMSISYEDLKSLIVAEVGGVCIQRPNLNEDKLAQLETVQNSWTGLRLEHLEACARRGADPSKRAPGVVVVSGGKKRAAGVCELIKKGLVNHLIVDDVLANELQKASH